MSESSFSDLRAAHALARQGMKHTISTLLLYGILALELIVKKQLAIPSYVNLFSTPKVDSPSILEPFIWPRFLSRARTVEKNGLLYI
jgi:hypothetical protein